MSFFAEYFSAATIRSFTPVVNIDQGSVFPQELPPYADPVSRFLAINVPAVYSLCIATLEQATRSTLSLPAPHSNPPGAAFVAVGFGRWPLFYFDEVTL